MKSKTSKMMFYAMNRSIERAIEGAFEGSHLAKHFLEKWNGNTGRYSTSTEKFLMWFYFEMSEGNRDIFIDWIDENYQG